MPSKSHSGIFKWALAFVLGMGSAFYFSNTDSTSQAPDVFGVANAATTDKAADETANDAAVSIDSQAAAGQQIAQLFSRPTNSPAKPSAKAAEDLRKNPPLNVTKLDDPMPRNLFVELSKVINPAIVSISSSQAQRQLSRRNGGAARDPMREFFEDFWGLPPGGPGRPFGGPGGQQPAPMALGSGFIISSDGKIITNNHVVENADVIKVQLDSNSKEEYEAQVIGRDARTDIALIKIDAKRPLPVAPLGSSSTLQVGEWVAAFGNPYGHAHTMTKGIVSAIGREIGELNRFPFIQTDASINPGNSGGPLVNTQGYVIGVNTAIDARAQGIGFAIPIDNVKTIVAQLEKDGRVHRGYIGVGISAIPPELARQLSLPSTDGVLVNQVQPGSPAAKAGIELYDIIIEFAGKPMTNPIDLQNAVANTDIGEKAKLKVLRFTNDKKKERTLEIKIAENPEDRVARTDRQPKRYVGQKAPFDLGFRVSDMTPQLREELGIPNGGSSGPVIIDVERGTPAAMVGLQAGDIILDVNRQAVRKATDVVKLLRQGPNLLRIARGNMIAVIAIEPMRGR